MERPPLHYIASSAKAETEILRFCHHENHPAAHVTPAWASAHSPCPEIVPLANFALSLPSHPSSNLLTNTSVLLKT